MPAGTAAAVAGVAVVATGGVHHSSPGPQTAVSHVSLDASYSKRTVQQRPRVSAGTSPVVITVAPGDSLSALAMKDCGGKTQDWTGLYAANKNAIGSNPDLIVPGEHLTLNCVAGPLTTAQTQHAAAIVSSDHEPDNDSDDTPSAPAGGKVYGVTYGDPNYCGDGDGDGWDRSCGAPVTQHSTAPVHYGAAVQAHVSVTGMGSMQSCIISRESGGNSQVMNSSGHYGLYQFSASTWAGSGGNPADFGHASAAEQNQVFANAVAARGYSDWTPYDGC